MQQATVQLPVRTEAATCAFYCYRQQFVAPRMGLGVTWALIPYNCSYPSYWRLFLHTQPEDARCRGERNPLIMACTLYYLIIYGTDIFAFP